LDEALDRGIGSDLGCSDAGALPGGLGRILAKNAKSAGENKQGDESVKHVNGSLYEKSCLTDIYRFSFSPHPHLAVHIAPSFRFQAVQGQPGDLILNG
jgi:hypothetical protein